MSFATTRHTSRLPALETCLATGTHIATQLPVAILGSAGGRLETGRILDYLENPNRKMCSLYLSMLDKFGIHLEKLGDSDQRLAEV